MMYRYIYTHTIRTQQSSTMSYAEFVAGNKARRVAAGVIRMLVVPRGTMHQRSDKLGRACDHDKSTNVKKGRWRCITNRIDSLILDYHERQREKERPRKKKRGREEDSSRLFRGSVNNNDRQLSWVQDRFVTDWLFASISHRWLPFKLLRQAYRNRKLILLRMRTWNCW